MRQPRTASALLALALVLGGAACRASAGVDDKGGEINVDVGDEGDGGD